MKIQLIFLGLLLIICERLQAQGKANVTGVIADRNGNLPGVVVMVKSQGIIAETDLDGYFVLLNVAEGDVQIEVMYMGYETKSISAKVPPSGVLNLNKIILNDDISDKNTLDEVIIKGEMNHGEQKAINITKQSTKIVNVIAAEGISKLPDKNAAEAVQRLSGVVVEKDHGEGRFVSFRGTPIDWSSNLVNGDRMPVADEESKSRALNFDIFPSSMIEYVIVAKSLTADVEGDAIGGSANFLTRYSPNKKMLKAQIGSGYNFKAQGPIYSGEILYGDRSKNGNFGYVMSASIYNRAWGTDNYQVLYGGGLENNQVVNRLELRNYLGHRQTIGLNGGLEYKFSQRTKLSATGILGNMKDDEWNRKRLYNYADGTGNAILLQNIHNIQITRFFGGNISLQHKFNEKSVLDFKVATYHSRFKYGPVPFKGNDPRNGYFVTEFKQSVDFYDYIYQRDDGSFYTIDHIDDASNIVDYSSRNKYLAIDSPLKGAGDHHEAIIPKWTNRPNDPFAVDYQKFLLNRAYSETNNTRESDPIVIQSDYEHKFNSKFKLKSGLKFRTKTGQRKVGIEYWLKDDSKLGGDVISLENFNTMNIPLYNTYLKSIGSPYADPRFQNRFLTKDETNEFINRYQNQYLEKIPYGPDLPPEASYDLFIASNYSYRESVYSGYLMGDYKFNDKWSINTGLRLEYTTPQVTALNVKTDSVDFATGNRIFETNNLSAGKNYLSLLPSLTIRFDLNPNTVLRLAVTRSLRRANFNEIKPGAPIVDYSNFVRTRGNPNLKPTYSTNSDLGIDHYWGNKGMIYVTGFYKYVTDHIYLAFDTISVENQQTAFITNRFENAPNAFIVGMESGIKRKMSFLPGIFKDFGLDANFTLSYSRMRIPTRVELQPFPRQAPFVGNVGVFFENNKITTRLALNHKSSYLMELNLIAYTDPVTNQSNIAQNTDFDLFMGRISTLDFSFAYQISKYFSTFLEVNNLNNAPFVIYRGQRERPVKVEYYSARVQLGLRFNLD
ncbi:MAG: TonB-dependent receptor [Cytophagales bacterium]